MRRKLASQLAEKDRIIKLLLEACKGVFEDHCRHRCPRYNTSVCPPGILENPERPGCLGSHIGRKLHAAITEAKKEGS